MVKASRSRKDSAVTLMCMCGPPLSDTVMSEVLRQGKAVRHNTALQRAFCGREKRLQLSAQLSNDPGVRYETSLPRDQHELSHPAACSGPTEPCQLFGPGSRPELFAKMAASAADVVNLDLEDSVSPDDKPKARENIIRATHEIGLGSQDTERQDQRARHAVLVP